MDRQYRQAFNAAYSTELFQRYLDRVQRAVGVESIPFRVAETPFFIPKQLRDRLARNAEEIVQQITNPALIRKCEAAVPEHLHVPNRDALANCIQVDFAIVRDKDGNLDGKLVELQGFPSLYALTLFQAEAWREELRKLPGLDRDWTLFFHGMKREEYLSRLRTTLLAGCDPSEVILMDLQPDEQKTYPDFAATNALFGIDSVCPSTLEREGRKLYRRAGGKRFPVRRIYNRVVFDELIKTGIDLPFTYTDDLEVTWVPHPNWYWIWSKYTVPFLDHPSVPRATFLSDLKSIPDDLSNYVLKPLFSFAGTGVKVDVTRADIEAIPDGLKREWILQEKISYEPALEGKDGNGIKAEVRMMFLRQPDEATPKLTMNLARLSRGKLLGVDHNRGFDWVGGTVGLFPGDE